MRTELDESRFAMWRAVIAMIHVDGVVKPHEVNFILESLRDLPLSEQQRTALNEDISNGQDVAEQFSRISRERDREDFFHFARTVSWSDGDFHEIERDALARLARMVQGGHMTQHDDEGVDSGETDGLKPLIDRIFGRRSA